MQKMQNAKIFQKMQVHFLYKEVPQKCRIMQMHESGHSTPS